MDHGRVKCWGVIMRLVAVMMRMRGLKELQNPNVSSDILSM